MSLLEDSLEQWSQPGPALPDRFVLSTPRKGRSVKFVQRFEFNGLYAWHSRSANARNCYPAHSDLSLGRELAGPKWDCRTSEGLGRREV